MATAAERAMGGFAAALKEGRTLPDRLVELVRLRIAFHNQCRSCMSIRYQDAVADGLTEDLVCSLETPAEADDLTPAESAAVAYADRFASDHLSIGAAQLKALREHFTPEEIGELAIQCAFFVGFGRMGAVFDDGSDLPVGPRPPAGHRLTPWGIEPAIVP